MALPARRACSLLWIALRICIALSQESEERRNIVKRSSMASLDQLFKQSDYDGRLRPDLNGSPVLVNCSILVKSFGPIEESTMDYTVLIYLQQTWNDPRIQSIYIAGNYHKDFLDLANNYITTVWKPDLYFENEKSAAFHNVSADNKMLRVFSNGDVFYSARLSLILACPMNLEYYPLDTQECRISLESFGYTNEDLIFQWSATQPLIVDANLYTSKFKLSNHTELGDCSKEYTTGVHSCINATFFLHRDMGYYLIQVYFPSCLLVIISWLSFWLSVESTPARVSLGITTILTVTTQMTSANAALPKMSYIKAMDVWMAACQVFVFAALLESTVVSVTKQRGLGGLAETQDQVREKALMRSRQIDYISRVLFPLAFLIFFVAYWFIYKNAPSYY